MEESAVAGLLARFAARSGLTRGIAGFCETSSRAAAENGRMVDWAPAALRFAGVVEEAMEPAV